MSFSVNLGDVFGFEMDSLDNEGEPGIMSVTNFSAPGINLSTDTAPEPGTGGIILASAVAAAIYRRATHARKSRKGNL
jgi:hypothetical protein